MLRLIFSKNSYKTKENPVNHTKTLVLTYTKGVITITRSNLKPSHHIAGHHTTTKDLTEGSLLKNILSFTAPIIATGIIQLLFNAADIVVVGRYASNTALAAVGSTGSIINLIVNLIIGLSVGAGVSVARCFGSKNDEGVSEVVHTAMLTALVGGVIFGCIGFFFAKVFLGWMNTPENVLGQASLYVQIYFVGVPFMVLYNFGAAILRSVGDTKTPLVFLIIAGVVNVAFNLVFVMVFHMDVAGVALATTISQSLSCVLVITHLLRTNECHKLQIKKLKIHIKRFKEILLVGIPAGIQGSLFSVSNVIIQSSINSFGDVAMSGNTAASNIEGFVYVAMNSFHQTALTFVGQHIGAKKEERIKKIAIQCLGAVMVIGLVLGVGAYLLGEQLLGIYASEDMKEQIISYGLIRLSFVSATYFLCGIMDVFSGLLRGMGKSIASMIISFVCICGLRIVWIYTIFPMYASLESIYVSYPISWLVSLMVQSILFIIYYKKLIKAKTAQNSD